MRKAVTAEAQATRDQASRLMTAGCWREAYDLLSKLCAESPDEYSDHWNCGWCLVKLGRPSDALTPLGRATQLEPARAESHWALGLAQAQAGLPNEAEHSFRQSLALKDSHMARLALGRLYLDVGRLADAENVYREGVRLQSEHRERVEALADFLSDIGRKAEALELYEKALTLKPTQVRKQKRDSA